MSEVKLRAWDIENKLMIDEFFEEGLYLQDGEIVIIYEAVDGNLYGKNVSDEYEIMQYTGIKDNGDKEICEGDIVEFNTIIYQVEKTVNCPSIDLWDKDNNRMDLNSIYSDEYKIIGNIYENPELLEVENE